MMLATAPGRLREEDWHVWCDPPSAAVPALLFHAVPTKPEGFMVSWLAHCAADGVCVTPPMMAAVGGTGPLGAMGGRGGRVFELTMLNASAAPSMRTWVRHGQDGRAPAEPRSSPPRGPGAEPRQWCCSGAVGCPW